MTTKTTAYPGPERDWPSEQLVPQILAARFEDLPHRPGTRDEFTPLEWPRVLLRMQAAPGRKSSTGTCAVLVTITAADRAEAQLYDPTHHGQRTDIAKLRTWEDAEDAPELGPDDVLRINGIDCVGRAMLRHCPEWDELRQRPVMPEGDFPRYLGPDRWVVDDCGWINRHGGISVRDNVPPATAKDARAVLAWAVAWLWQGFPRLFAEAETWARWGEAQYAIENARKLREQVAAADVRAAELVDAWEELDAVARAVKP